MKAYRLPAIIFILLISISVGKAQQAADSAQHKASPAAVQNPDGKKNKGKKKEKETVNMGETSVTGKKTKGKKKSTDNETALKLDSTSTRADSINAALPKALRNAKNAKAAPKKANPKKAPKPIEEAPEPKIIPGAEAKANAETKDREDRTMKGPSGQKVYLSPKGGKYYFDINGNKKFIKKDVEK
jgi:hypothetical protein